METMLYYEKEVIDDVFSSSREDHALILVQIHTKSQASFLLIRVLFP